MQQFDMHTSINRHTFWRLWSNRLNHYLLPPGFRPSNYRGLSLGQHGGKCCHLYHRMLGTPFSIHQVEAQTTWLRQSESWQETKGQMIQLCQRKIILEDFSGGPVVKTLLSVPLLQGLWVCSLVRELRSHMHCRGSTKKKKDNSPWTQ